VIDPSSKAYVPHLASGVYSLAIIDTKSRSINKTISLFQGSTSGSRSVHSIDIAAAGNGDFEAYVIGGDKAMTTYVINIESGQVDTTIDVENSSIYKKQFGIGGGLLTGVVFGINGNLAYALDVGNDALVVIKTWDKKIQGPSVQSAVSIPPGQQLELEIKPDGKEIYITHHGGTVDIFNTQSSSVSTIPVLGTLPSLTDVDFTLDGQNAWVLDKSTFPPAKIRIVDTSSQMELPPEIISTQRLPTDIEIDPVPLSPIIGGPGCGSAGENYAFPISIPYIEAGRGTYQVDWGDGTTIPLSNVNEVTTSHSWKMPGTYHITVQAEGFSVDVPRLGFRQIKIVDQWGILRRFVDTWRDIAIIVEPRPGVEPIGFEPLPGEILVTSEAIVGTNFYEEPQSFLNTMNEIAGMELVFGQQVSKVDKIGDVTINPDKLEAYTKASSELVGFLEQSPEPKKESVDKALNLQNEVNVAAQSAFLSLSSAVFVVEGNVWETNETLAGNDLKVEIKNLTTDVSLSDVTGAAGDSRYSVTFVDVENQQAMTVGDQIKVTVYDDKGIAIGMAEHIVTADEVGDSKSIIDVTLRRQLQFAMKLVKGINCISIPLKDERINRVSDLAKLLGEEVSLIISYDVEQQKFQSFTPSSPESTPANVKINGYTGLILVMKGTPSEPLILEGVGWSGDVRLTEGLNLIGVPLKAPNIEKVSDLMEIIGGDIVSAISYNIGKGKFNAFTPDTPTTASANIDIDGDVGFIVVMREDASFTLEGEAWDKLPAEMTPAATPIFALNLTNSPLLEVDGIVIREDTGESLNNLSVTVHHLSTGVALTDTTSSKTGDGRFSVTFVYPFEDQSVKVGDVLKISVDHLSSGLKINPIQYTVTQKDIEANRIALGEIVALAIPKRSGLLQNYPNPFNPETWIPFKLSKDSNVTIRIFNAAGQLVRTIELGEKHAGYYINKEKAAYWNGRNNFGEAASSGVYFYQLMAGTFSVTKRMVIIK
jgi:hypothetical protein